MAKSSSSITADVAIALATIPTLVGLVVMKGLDDMMTELGLSSEEIFRGDRLPILNMPTMPKTDSTPDD